MGRPIRPAKEPVTVLAGPYGHPLHPALVAFPIGAWVASFVFDVVSVLGVDARWLGEAAMWLIGLGVVGAAVAAVVGFLDLTTIPTRTRVFRVALTHMSLNLGATALFVVGFLLRQAQAPSEPLSVGLIVLSAVALALVGTGGFLGGELAYRYGVRVVDEDTQAEGYRGADSTT